MGYPYEDFKLYIWNTEVGNRREGEGFCKNLPPTKKKSRSQGKFWQNFKGGVGCGVAAAKIWT